MNNMKKPVYAALILVSTTFLLAGCSSPQTITQSQAGSLVSDNPPANPMNSISFIIPIVLAAILVFLIIRNQMTKRKDLAKNGAMTTLDLKKELAKLKHDAPRPELQKEYDIAKQIQSGTAETSEGEWALQVINQSVKQGTLSETVKGKDESKAKKGLFGKKL